MATRGRAQAYRETERRIFNEMRVATIKDFYDLIFTSSGILSVWIACNIGSMSDAQLVYMASRVPMLFQVISRERQRRAHMV